MTTGVSTVTAEYLALVNVGFHNAVYLAYIYAARVAKIRGCELAQIVKTCVKSYGAKEFESLTKEGLARVLTTLEESLGHATCISVVSSLLV